MEITQRILDLCSRTVGDLVAEDYRRADVFKKYGIDFCCGGNKTVEEACEAKGVTCEEIMQALAAAEESSLLPNYVNVRSWEPDFLASYIVNVHHRYVREHGPILRELMQTVARIHGDTNPETMQISGLVDELIQELGEHAETEEKELFPYVEALCAASCGEAPLPRPAAGAAADPIEALEHEHDQAGALMREIRTLSRGFQAPEAACNTFRVAYAKLEQFEADLHRHVHLENNILFPAARRLEQELARPA